MSSQRALAPGKELGAPLCTNRNGKPLYETRYWFQRALEVSGVKEFTWHDLRHTVASQEEVGDAQSISHPFLFDPP
ncbi:MAG: hypothetical protein ABSF53_25465 [Terracidiphilus sp.]